ncbi:MAG TPA: sialidase family protein [Pirellulales bacterium]|jgi:sialidase-1
MHGKIPSSAAASYWLAMLMLFAPLATVAGAGEAWIKKTDLFRAGDGVYKLYHIPGIVVTKSGTVLAWAEARRGRGDWNGIDILLRRSTDEGATWSEPVKMPQVSGPKTKNPVALELKNVKATDVTYNNPVFIADRDGTVTFLFCLEYCRCFASRSQDDGRTWSQPVEITSVFETFRKDYPWQVIATGPDHGIQLASGRLLVPIWMSTGTGGNAHRPSVVATIYSDDHGRTWQAGAIAVPCTDQWVNPNETTAAELADGRVMLNVRNESPRHRRLITTSRDGATQWSTPRFDDALVEPICMGSLVRLSTEQSDGRDRLLFVNPANLSRADGKETAGGSRDRRNLTVRLSYDEGESWPVAKTLDEGWSTYSDLAVTLEGTILCFYGRGEKSDFAGDRLTLARFNLQWLSGGKDNLTPPPKVPSSATK